MIGTHRLAAAVAAIAAAAAFAAPAQAQNTTTFTQAKLIHRADTAVPIAGPGVVVIQVMVFADGSHRVTHIIRSTNPGDNNAAIDIAKNSTYRPQHRGTKAVTGFYDYTIRFTGKAVASSKSAGTTMTGASAQVDTLIRAGKYDAAKARAQQALASKPNDATLNQQLATAEFFLKDYPSAAAAFDRIPTISKPFMQVAAQSYAMAAETLSTTDAASAVSYAEKAVALAPSGGTYYALGAAEFGSGNITSAVRDLEKARTMAFADPKTDVKSRVNIDAALLQAYLKANDKPSADRIEAEITQLDPTNTTVKRMIGNQYLASGNAASRANKHDEALQDFLQAAKAGDSAVAVTGYASAALEENTILNAPGKAAAVPNDYLTKMKPYADQALAINADDSLANYALGVAMAGAWISGGKVKADYKAQALAALNKAKSEAQAQGNIALSLNIDNFIKQNMK